MPNSAISSADIFIPDSYHMQNMLRIAPMLLTPHAPADTSFTTLNTQRQLLRRAEELSLDIEKVDENIINDSSSAEN